MAPSLPVEEMLQSRYQTYGCFREQSDLSGSIKSSTHHVAGWAELDYDQQEALDMIVVKMSRILTGDCDHTDSWDDIAGYAMLISKRLNGEEI